MRISTRVVHLVSLLVLTTPFRVTMLDGKEVDGQRKSGVCPSHRLYDPISMAVYPIPDTRVGHAYSSARICMTNGQPYVELECLNHKVFGPQWSVFHPNQACNFTQLPTSAASVILRELCLMDFRNTSISSTALNTTLSLTQNPSSLSALDVVYIADVVQLTVEQPTVSAKSAETILSIVDNLMEVNDTVFQLSRRAGNATNRIILSLERLGEKVALNSNNDGTQSIRLVTGSLAVEVWSLSSMTDNGRHLAIGLDKRETGEVRSRVLKTDNLVTLFENDSLDINTTEAAIVLPALFLRNLTEENPGKEVRLTMGIFSDTSLFGGGGLESRIPKERDDFYRLNSKVISAKVTVEGKPIIDMEGHNVTTVFLPYHNLALRASHVRHTRCVFWKFEGQDGQAAWSDEGCKFQDNDHGRDVCQFNHLTNFAILMDLYGQSHLLEEHQTALSIITIVGLSLSISGLSITILAFLRISKLRKGRRQQVLFNLALAMLLSWVIFLAGFTRVGDHIGCRLVAALLHYFILASFMWMLMEGVLQYLLFVKVLGTSFSHFITKTALLAWGLPLLPLTVVLAIDPELYAGGQTYCWMSLQAFYYAFLLPMALIMVANIVIYIMVVVNICRRGGFAAKASVQDPAVTDQKHRAVGIRASFACFVVLGLSWVFAFFAIEDARVVFRYLFTITTSLQGLLIFLVFTARDANVRNVFNRLSRRLPFGASKYHHSGGRSNSTTTICTSVTELSNSRSTLYRK